MRTRNRSVPFICSDHYGVTTEYKYTHTPQWSFNSFEALDTSWLHRYSEISTIEDDPGPYKLPGRDPSTGMIRSMGNSSPKIVDGQIEGIPPSAVFGAKECHHVSVKTKFESNLVLMHTRVDSPGNQIYEREVIRTTRFDDGLQLLSWYPGGLDLLDEGHSPEFDMDYIGHDWFALADQFNEMCDQYTRSGFLIGEDMAENEIFVDAIKLVINPTHAIRIFLKAAKGIKNIRKMSLGRAAHHIAKKSSNAYLAYTFGVKPAINDIKDAIDAHQKVSSRLNYLRRNAGLFVPIRAKKEIPSVLGSEPPEITPGLSDDLKWFTAKHSSTAVISALGRVRSDLSHGSDWAAYLQYFGVNKVIGLAWELIPFSFVVDWFTNAQERLNSLTRLHIGDGPFVEFRNICHSVKLHHSENLYWIPGRDESFGGGCISPTSAILVASRDYTDYNRGLGIPDTSGVFDFSTLGLFHAITGASLIVQRT